MHYEEEEIYGAVDEPVTEEPTQQDNKGRFSKLILQVMLMFLLLFTVAVLFISYKTGDEPSTLITCVFTFCGVEGGCLAWIKTIKNRR